ncbi:conserved hypothetical protein [Ricinus communis]|uniref:Uncharacterized protein n=1 Tax=Ricinus communis TaxID=3988 RepID=B9S104_RICCO|nr:conserved hypothetical protein [Ricinus communis]
MSIAKVDEGLGLKDLTIAEECCKTLVLYGLESSKGYTSLGQDFWRLVGGWLILGAGVWIPDVQEFKVSSMPPTNGGPTRVQSLLIGVVELGMCP